MKQLTKFQANDGTLIARLHELSTELRRRGQDYPSVDFRIAADEIDAVVAALPPAQGWQPQQGEVIQMQRDYIAQCHAKIDALVALARTCFTDDNIGKALRNALPAPPVAAKETPVNGGSPPPRLSRSPHGS